jgi:hypothetical protein
VDGVVRVDTDAPSGSFVEVRITDVVDDFDFSASVIRTVSAPAAVQVMPGRALPLVTTSTVGSFGR